MPNTQTGQITLAIIATKQDAMMELLKTQSEQLRVIQSCQDQWKHIPKDVENLRDDVDQLQTDMTETKTRGGIIGGINAALAVIGSAIAGFLGTR